MKAAVLNAVEAVVCHTIGCSSPLGRVSGLPYAWLCNPLALRFFDWRGDQ